MNAYKSIKVVKSEESVIDRYENLSDSYVVTLNSNEIVVCTLLGEEGQLQTEIFKHATGEIYCPHSGVELMTSVKINSTLAKSIMKDIEEILDILESKYVKACAA